MPYYFDFIREINQTIRLLTMPIENIQYSDRYCDDMYEYRHVILPADLAKKVPKNHLMTETEWRNLGVQQSPGWIHYMMHGPEPHILLFRRLKPGVNIAAMNNGGSGRGRPLSISVE